MKTLGELDLPGLIACDGAQQSLQALDQGGDIVTGTPLVEGLLDVAGTVRGIVIAQQRRGPSQTVRAAQHRGNIPLGVHLTELLRVGTVPGSKSLSSPPKRLLVAQKALLNRVLLNRLSVTCGCGRQPPRQATPELVDIQRL